ncbi:MAG: hypothetical protein WD472_07880, partial [Dehalococcoidia bacterium]
RALGRPAARHPDEAHAHGRLVDRELMFSAKTVEHGTPQSFYDALDAVFQVERVISWGKDCRR